MSNEQIAVRDWHTRAIVRVVTQSGSNSVDPQGTRIFRVGEEIEMVQWGNEGRPVLRDTWWDSFDIDGAHIIRASNVEVVKVLDEVLPYDVTQASEG